MKGEEVIFKAKLVKAYDSRKRFRPWYVCKHNMLWIWRLSQTTSSRIIQVNSLKSLHNLSSSMCCLTDKTQKFSRENIGKNFPEKTRVTFTPQIVQSTLVNCTSDVMALSFFLWCARQPNYFHDCRAFDHMVNVANRLTERFRTVKGVVEELKRVGCVIKPQAFLILLRIYWRGGMYGLVFEAFQEMDRYGYAPNTFACNVVMDVLFRIGQVDVALRVLRDTQVPNFLTFNIALCNLCKLNDLSNIHDVFRIMLREGYYPNFETFEMVLNCFCKVGRLAEALQVLGLMITLGLRVSVTVWSILIDGFCRLGRLGMAADLLEKMVETGCSPNVVTYTSLIKGFMESQKVGSAFRILSTMESKGCAPDLVLCNVLIDCLSKIGRHGDAVDVFVSLPKRRLEADSYTFTSLLSALCMSQKFSLLPKLVSGCVIKADLVVCNSLLSYFCKAGYPSHAVEFYNDMVEKEFMPDAYSFVGLLRGLCGAGKIDEAVNVYRGIVMNHSGLDAYIHTVIMDGLIKVGKFHRAIRLFRKAALEKYPLDVVSYTVAIRGLLKGGRTKEACILYSQMKEVGLDPNAHTYNVMLSVFCKERDVNMVTQMLQEMIDAGLELDSYTFIRVTDFMFKSHSSCSAFNLLIEMWDLGLMPDKVMHSLLLDGLAHGVKVGDAHHSLLKGYLEDNLFVSTSGSDDLSDVATSVG